MSLNTVKLGLKKWLQETIYKTVIFAEQASPRPSKLPYGIIRIDSIDILGGQDWVKPADASGNQVVTGDREVTANIEIYGPGAHNLMETAQLSLGRPTVQENLWVTYGISIVDIEPIVNLNEVLETEWEERAQMNIMFYYRIQTTDEVGLIEQVEINDEIIDISTP